MTARLATARSAAGAYAGRAKAGNTRRAYRAGVRAWCDRYVLAFELRPVSGQSGMECDRPNLERALNGRLPESHSRPQRGVIHRRLPSLDGKLPSLDANGFHDRSVNPALSTG